MRLAKSMIAINLANVSGVSLLMSKKLLIGLAVTSLSLVACNGGGSSSSGGSGGDTPPAPSPKPSPSPTPAGSWIIVGADDYGIYTGGNIVFDPITNSVYQIRNGTLLCSINVDASSETNWSCQPTYTGYNSYGNNLATDGAGHLFSTAQVSSLERYIITYSTSNHSLTNSTLLTGEYYMFSVSDYIGYSQGNLYQVSSSKTLIEVDLATGMVNSTMNAFNPEFISASHSFTIDKDSNLYYGSGQAAYYVDINTIEPYSFAKQIGVSFPVSGLPDGVVDLSVAENNLILCGAHNVYSIPLGSAATTPWTVLPPTSSYQVGPNFPVVTTGCFNSTGGGQYIYATAMIMDSNGGSPSFRLMKYKY